MLDDIFENFRREMESIFSPLLSYSLADWRVPIGLAVVGEERVPLCDMMDKGDKYEIHLEVPGIEKEKVNIKATKNSLQITGVQPEKLRIKARIRYITSDHIVPSEVTAKMNNDMLLVDLPKTMPTKPSEETTRV
jgi:HSP20 family protein